MRLEPLGELKLAYDEGGFTLVQPFGTEEGSGWGGGDGTIDCERLRGRVRWRPRPGVGAHPPLTDRR